MGRQEANELHPKPAFEQLEPRLLLSTGILNDYNPYNVSIPDNNGSVNSDLSLSGAPSGATITKVKTYYEIRHTYPGDLDVWLTAYYNGDWQNHWLYQQGDLGGTDNIIETRDNITTFNGVSPNQTWYLVARDGVPVDIGYIDFFEMWVTYQVNDAPTTPTSEDPPDNATGVSINKNLDWSCSDPEGDTVYYTVYFEKNDSSPDNLIKNDATGSYADPGTLDYDSHYYWQVKADDHNDGVTWGPVWDFYTESAPTVGDADITVKNHNNVTVTDQNAWVEMYVDGSLTSDATNASGVAEFNNIEAGTWGYEVYYNSTGYVEYWGDDSIPVPVGDTGSDTFARFYPFISQLRYYDVTAGEYVSGPVPTGHEVEPQLTVTNNVSQSLKFKARLALDHDNLGDYDYDNTSLFESVSGNGGTNTINLPKFIPEPGESYDNRYWLTTELLNGNTPYTDTAGFYDAFDVDQPLPLDGRIAYHSYSGYMASPVDSTDGHIFIYRIDNDSLSNVTSGQPIENAMNPHFSSDGSKIIFMAIPIGAARNRNSLEVYVYNLANSSLSRLTSNSAPDEDPKFSPDSQHIVWKRQGQIWRMNTDGTNPNQLTYGGLEKSGPNYSPDSSQIVYWVGTRAADNEDIWLMSAGGSSQTPIVANVGIYDYYPIYRDSANILYSRAESASSDYDKIYNYNIGSGASTALLLNQTGANDSDASPLNTTYVTFSSTRSGSGYDVFVGRYDNGVVYTLSAANSAHEDLGPTYSQYAYARAAAMLTPSDGSSLDSGSTSLLTARLWSDGSAWTGASPTVIFQGPTTIEYTGLRDDGTGGDVTSGDGVYSKTVTLPSEVGVYSVFVSVISDEGGVAREIRSDNVNAVNINTSSPRIVTLLLDDHGDGTLDLYASTLGNNAGIAYYNIDLVNILAASHQSPMGFDLAMGGCGGFQWRGRPDLTGPGALWAYQDTLSGNAPASLIYGIGQTGGTRDLRYLLGATGVPWTAPVLLTTITYDTQGPGFSFGNSIAFNLFTQEWTEGPIPEGIVAAADEVRSSSLVAGDFDLDGDVDGVDFGIWQANYPTASGASRFTGDADYDGDVDGVDFGIWQANYPTNVGGGTTVAMTTTPAPASEPVATSSVLDDQLVSPPAVSNELEESVSLPQRVEPLNSAAQDAHAAAMSWLYYRGRGQRNAKSIHARSRFESPASRRSDRLVPSIQIPIQLSNEDEPLNIFNLLQLKLPLDV